MKSMCIRHMLLLLMLLALAACGTPAAPSAGVPATAAATPTSTAAAVGVPQSTLSAQHATEEARLLTARATPTSVATQSTAPTSAPAAPTAITLIDPQQPLASADAPAWQFQRSATADFDGDGVEETAFIIADAVVENGRALWDHGHRWQVYIEEPDGTRTFVYARFLPNGKLEALLSGPIDAPIPTITLLERTPFTLALYELRYRGPQQVEAVELVQRELDPRRFFEGTPE